jgi:hypothetical protein
MLKKYILLLILIFTAIGQKAYSSQNFGPANIKDEKDLTKDIVIEPVQLNLPAYEKLFYTVRWLGVPVGFITASINGMKEINGRQCYMLQVNVKTNAFCSAIYKIDDKFVSYMDSENFYTLRHEVYRREGRYKKDAITDFDHIAGKAYFKNLIDKSEKVFDIPYGVQDTLSACYYFRLLPVEIGKKVEYAVCNNEAIYQLLGVVDSKSYIRVSDLGINAAFHIQPYAQIKGEQVKKGKVSGYFSANSKRLPLLAVVQAPMFTEVTATLQSLDYRQNSEHQI